MIEHRDNIKGRVHVWILQDQHTDEMAVWWMATGQAGIKKRFVSIRRVYLSVGYFPHKPAARRFRANLLGVVDWNDNSLLLLRTELRNEMRVDQRWVGTGVTHAHSTVISSGVEYVFLVCFWVGSVWSLSLSLSPSLSLSLPPPPLSSHLFPDLAGSLPSSLFPTLPFCLTYTGVSLFNLILSASPPPSLVYIAHTFWTPFSWSILFSKVVRKCPNIFTEHAIATWQWQSCDTLPPTELGHCWKGLRSEMTASEMTNSGGIHICTPQPWWPPIENLSAGSLMLWQHTALLIVTNWHTTLLVVTNWVVWSARATLGSRVAELLSSLLGSVRVGGSEWHPSFHPWLAAHAPVEM